MSMVIFNSYVKLPEGTSHFKPIIQVVFRAPVIPVIRGFLPTDGILHVTRRSQRTGAEEKGPGSHRSRSE